MQYNSVSSSKTAAFLLPFQHILFHTNLTSTNNNKLQRTMTDSPRVQCLAILDALPPEILSDEEISNSVFMTIYNARNIADSSDRPRSSSLLKSKIGKGEFSTHTNFHGFSYCEEDLIDAATILRRLPCLTKTIPERLFLPPNDPSDEDAATGSITYTNSAAFDGESLHTTDETIVSHSSTSITSNTLEAEEPNPYEALTQVEKRPCKTFSRTCQCRRGTRVTHNSTPSASANSNAAEATHTEDVPSSTVSDLINNEKDKGSSNIWPLSIGHLPNDFSIPLSTLREDEGGVVNDFEECGKLCPDVLINEVLPCEKSCPVLELEPSFASLSPDLTVATASTASVPAKQHIPRRGCLRPSSTISEEESATLGIKTKKKTVRFVEGLKDNEDIQTGGAKITEYPEGSEQVQDLIQEVYDNPTLRDAIELLPPDTLSEIASSLENEIAIPLASASADIRCQKVKSTYDAPVSDLTKKISDPDELKSYKQLLKQYLLNYLDEKTNQRYLCRASELFHLTSWHRYNLATPSFSIECPSQQVLNCNPSIHRLFIAPFRFSQIQHAMKLFRHGMSYGKRLKPLPNALPEIGTNFSCVRTSEVYPVADEEHGERLFSRIQNWYHTSPDIENPLSEKEMKRLGPLMGRDSSMTHLCSHLMERYSKDKNQGFILWDYDDLDSNPRVRRCEHCALEYRYDWYEAGQYGSGLVLTTWRDFGKCLTPFDPRWRVHFEEYDDIAPVPDHVAKFRKVFARFECPGSDSRSKDEEKLRWLVDMEPAAPSWEVGQIQKMFEGNDEFDLQWCVQRMMESEKMREGPFESLPGKRKRHFERESRRERKQTPNGSTESA
jgi:hypothetical protein